MTISTSYSVLSYSGNGATTAFAISWQFFDDDEIVATIIDSDGVETAKTLTTHYTVAGGADDNAGAPSTGTLTMLTAPATGETLRIQRATVKTRASVNLTNVGAFDADSVEWAIDRIVLASQEEAGGGSVNDGITGDVMQLNSSGATDYWDAESQILRNLADPTGDTDAVTKSYGDTNYGGSSVTLAAASATAAAASATSAASSAATASDAADAAQAVADGLTYGAWDASAGTFPGSGSAQAGYAYLVSVAGTVDSVSFGIGDEIVAITDNASTSTYAGNWLKRDHTDMAIGLKISQFLTSDDPDVDQSAEVTAAITRLFDTNYSHKELDFEGKLIGISSKLSFICGSNGFTSSPASIKNQGVVIRNGGLKWLGSDDTGNFMLTMGCPTSVVSESAFQDLRFESFLWHAQGNSIGPVEIYNYYNVLFDRCIFRNFNSEVGIFSPSHDASGVYTDDNGLICHNCRWLCLPTTSLYTGPPIRAYCGDIVVDGGYAEWTGPFDFHIGSVTITGFHWALTDGSPTNMRYGAIFRDPREIIITHCDMDTAGIRLTNDGYLSSSGITSGSPTHNAETNWRSIVITDNKYVAPSVIPVSGDGIITLETTVASTTLEGFYMAGNVFTCYQGSDNVCDALAVIASGSGTYTQLNGTYIYVDAYGVQPGDQDLGASDHSITTGFRTFIDNGSLKSHGGTASAPNFANYSASGMYFPTTATIAWSLSGTKKLDLLSTGAVITPGTASGTTADTSYDDFVVDSDATGGITILTGNTSTGALVFGDTDSNYRGAVAYNHNADQLLMASGGSYKLLLSTSALRPYTDALLSLGQNGTEWDSVHLDSKTAANIADIANAINTSGKGPGKVVWDATNNRLMVASGTTAASAWYVADGSASVTPA